MMSYNRPWKSHQEQLAILTSRGLEVSDEPKVINYLKRLGYYRLGGYCYPFHDIQLTTQNSGSISYQRLDNFMPQAQFQDAVHLYVYDKKLRLLALNAFQGKPHLISRSFLMFCMMQYLLHRICLHSSWHQRFNQLIHDFPEISIGSVCVDNMGWMVGKIGSCSNHIEHNQNPEQ